MMLGAGLPDSGFDTISLRDDRLSANRPLASALPNGAVASGRPARYPIYESPSGLLNRRRLFIPQREAVAIAHQADIALMEGVQCRPVADRDDRGLRQLLLEQAVQRGLRGFVERGGRLVEEQVVRRVQQRAYEPEALLFAQRQRPIPVPLRVGLRRK